MEYNPFQHQDRTDFEALRSQEFTHMNNVVFIYASALKNKQTNKNKNKNKKIDLPILPIFRPKGQTNIFIFLGLIS